MNIHKEIYLCHTDNRCLCSRRPCSCLSASDISSLATFLIAPLAFAHAFIYSAWLRSDELFSERLKSVAKKAKAAPGGLKYDDKIDSHQAHHLIRSRHATRASNRFASHLYICFARQ